jgi:glycosyltransferase involved in cell wall biosynthesis
MKIFLDTHMLGRKETGNERYWQNLAVALIKQVNQQDSVIYYPQSKNAFYYSGLYRIGFGFNKVIKKYNPDIIHVQNFAPWKKTLPTVVTVHDLCFKKNPLWFGLKTRMAFRYFFQRSLKIADAIICVSKSTKKELLRLYPVNHKKVHVIYEAADSCFYYIFDKKKVRKTILKKFGIKENYFLVVGNIEQRKQSRLILETFQKNVINNTKTKLVFVGSNKLGVKSDKNVFLLGYVSDVELNLLYNGALSLVYLSLCEGFGLPLVEAMTCRIPIICSDIPVFREIAAQSALYVNNESELSKAMSNLIINKSLRYKYSKLAFQRSSYFSWQKTAKQTLFVYKNLL